MDFSAIFNHPDYNDIVSRLINGEDPKELSKSLKFKYSAKDETHLRLSTKLLQDFVDSDQLNLYSQLQGDINSVKTGSIQKVNKNFSDSLVNTKSYRERLAEIADSELDIKRNINNLVNLCNTRVEQLFDIMQSDPLKFKADNYFLRYMTELLNMLEKFDRIINKAPDQIIQHNVSIQMAERYTYVLQDAVREVLAEMDPEISMIFMEKLDKKLKDLKPPEEETQESKAKKVQLLSEVIVRENNE